MVDDVSNVPLTKDILGKELPFVFSYYDWLSTRGERILKSAFSISTDPDIYTVPEGRVLFITSAWLTGNVVMNPAGAGAFLEVAGVRIIGVHTDHVADGGIAVANSFPIPIKVEAGETIESSVGNNLQFSGGITGFQVHKSDLVFT